MVDNNKNNKPSNKESTQNSEIYRLNETVIKIDKNSIFNGLSSPLIQREILQRIYKILSGGKMLNYEITCKLLTMINDDIGLGKKGNFFFTHSTKNNFIQFYQKECHFSAVIIVNKFIQIVSILFIR
jgi:hypothetical protein